MKQEIFGLEKEKLTELFAACGLKKFRSAQVFDWIYKKCIFDFHEMTNLSQKDRDLLSEGFSILPGHIAVKKELCSLDGLTDKLLVEFSDGCCVETVLMRHDYGNSVCVSSQAGCDMGCAFCASTIAGAQRNLTASEILAQVYLFEARLKKEAPLSRTARVGHVIVMGSGEPMLNFDNVFSALKFLHDEDAAGISYRNMTVSTCGIVPGIKKMAELDVPISLAVSLHAVKDEVRDRLMPVNKAYPFRDVIEAAGNYARSSGRQVTYEYILIKGINDADEDAALLSRILKGKGACVNLIPVNPVREKGFLRPSKDRIERFHDILLKGGIYATIRKEMGADINAACGQLRAAQLKEDGI